MISQFVLDTCFIQYFTSCCNHPGLWPLSMLVFSSIPSSHLWTRFKLPYVCCRLLERQMTKGTLARVRVILYKSWKSVVLIHPKEESSWDCDGPFRHTWGHHLCGLPFAFCRERQSSWGRKSKTGWNLLFCYLIPFSLEEKRLREREQKRVFLPCLNSTCDCPFDLSSNQIKSSRKEALRRRFLSKLLGSNMI